MSTLGKIYYVGEDQTWNFLGKKVFQGEDSDFIRKSLLDKFWDTRLDITSCSPAFVIIKGYTDHEEGRD